MPDSKGPVSNILKDPDFQNVINRGATEETYKFVCVNKQRIQEILERRLDVRLGLEYVMEPKLLIYDPKSRERGTLDPAFVAAKETLDAGDFGRAATLFDRMAPRLQGVSRNIVRDYQAYALAKDKKQMPARLELDQICGEEFYSPSAYWNLACCQLSEDMEQRLETFVAGLKHAPHPRLLDGAVYLGLFLNDARTVDWLPCLTYTEALLLYYKLEYEGAELSNQEKQAHVLRLGRYSVEGELVMPEPMNDRLPEAQIQRYMTGLLERKQPAAFEFWLRCRELISTNRYQHWEVKADFLEKTGRRAEAAKAFEEEFRARLRYFGILARNAKDRRRASELLQYTRRRLDTWLGFCWPELKNVGFNLFNMAKNFEKQYDTSIVSNRLRKIYDTEPPPLPPTPPTPTPTPENLSQILTTVGAECQSRLRDLSELSSVRWHLDTLLDALRRGSSDGSTEALGLLMGQWENYSRLVIDTERQTALLKAQTAYADLRKNLQRELTDQQWSLAGPFLNACKRVNESLARDAKLLPNLTVEAVTEGAVEVDSTAEHTGFALRVRCASGDTAVRLKGATLTLDDSVTTFALRDRLEEVQMQVGPTDTCVLSFDTAPNLRLIQPRTLQCVLAFEYAGGDYHTPPLKLQLVQRVCPPLPNDSPYISGRPLDPVEIEGHFFGRKEEQEAVLASVRDGQQRLRYVCGIRRAGKSSLLNSIEYEVGKRSLPLIPVYLSAGEVKSLTSVGRFLFNLLAKISSHSDIAGAGVQPPPEERCCENMPLAYSQFVKDLAEKIPGRRVLALLDDFQSLIEAASDARDHNPAVTSGIAGLLNIIYANGNPRARILWVFAGLRYSRNL